MPLPFELFYSLPPLLSLPFSFLLPLIPFTFPFFPFYRKKKLIKKIKNKIKKKTKEKVKKGENKTEKPIPRIVTSVGLKSYTNKR